VAKLAKLLRLRLCTAGCTRRGCMEVEGFVSAVNVAVAKHRLLREECCVPRLCLALAKRLLERLDSCYFQPTLFFCSCTSAIGLIWYVAICFIRKYKKPSCR